MPTAQIVDSTMSSSYAARHWALEMMVKFTKLRVSETGRAVKIIKDINLGFEMKNTFIYLFQ